jgi:reactive intermediate/imine deaminase
MLVATARINMKRLIMMSLALTFFGAPMVHAKEFFTREENALLKLPFSDAVRVGDVVYLSGQLGLRPGTLELVPGGFEAEARQAIENMAATLNAGFGLGLADIVKCTGMLADMKDWPTFNKIYLEYFKAPLPVRSSFGATGLVLNARIEIECMAVVPKNL